MLKSHENLDLPCSSLSVEEVGAAELLPSHVSSGILPHLVQKPTYYKWFPLLTYKPKPSIALREDMVN
ncbi:hypothetical protein P7K49_024231 [Saguinus oedipus]|uniref:Uncharacterized protein n=1 Tax=Saguinus oedipus TaxID=9490 RepID=A0ABQ9UNY7_SAGOE|nr:hypothetical protein P7K49_024231 [Saguinus oedipus]